MSEFAFLFRVGAGGSRTQTPQKVMQKWVAWIKDLGERGIIKDRGRALERTGKLITSNPKIVSTALDGETKNLIGGYMVVEARDLGHAVELTSGCPVFEAGGLVEVRPIMSM